MKLEPYKIDFGKHSGEDALRLCFSDPAYVHYVLNFRDADGPLLALRPKLQRLITAGGALAASDERSAHAVRDGLHESGAWFSA